MRIQICPTPITIHRGELQMNCTVDVAIDDAERERERERERRTFRKKLLTGFPVGQTVDQVEISASFYQLHPPSELIDKNFKSIKINSALLTSTFSFLNQK